MSTPNEHIIIAYTIWCYDRHLIQSQKLWKQIVFGHRLACWFLIVSNFANSKIGKEISEYGWF